MNDGVAAGQTVMQVHVYSIPLCRGGGAAIRSELRSLQNAGTRLIFCTMQCAGERSPGGPMSKGKPRT